MSALEREAEIGKATKLIPAFVGFNMQKKNVFNNLGSSLLYGLLGTFLNCTVLILLFFWVDQNDAIMRVTHESIHSSTDLPKGARISLTSQEIFLLGAALSSKDSFTAALVIDHHAFPNLHSIVFGEGLINDSTAIALFQAILNSHLLFDDHLEAMTIVNFIGTFLLSIVMAIVIGISLGMIGSLVLKHLRFLRKSPM